MASPVALALAAPPLLVAACAAAVLAMSAAGRDPFWSEAPRTVAEAAAAGDHARVLQMIRQGHDPNRAAPEGTPLDFAVRAGDVRLVRLLLNHGVLLDDEARREVACTALRQGSGDIYSVVRGDYPITCEAHR